MRLAAKIAGLLLLTACGAAAPARETVLFETRTGDLTATLEMPPQLPPRDFSVVLRTSTGDRISSKFEYVPAGRLDCYWHQTFPMLCRDSGRAGQGFPGEVSDGRHVRAEQLGGGLIRHLVFGSEEEKTQEFADFRGARLEAFGFVDQDTGATSQLWRRRP